MSAVTASPMDTVHTVAKQLVSDQVYTLVRGWVLAGKLAPGARVVESALAKQLGVSQAPVRDAVGRLVHEGFLLQIAHQGSFVADISVDRVHDACEVRLALEETAARNALAHVDAALIDSLRAAVQEMRSAAAANDPNAVVVHDMAFHRAIWEAGGNQMLGRIWSMVESSIQRFTAVENSLFSSDLGAVADRHLPIIDAFLQGDPESAVHLLVEHTRIYHDRVQELTRKNGSHP